MSEAKKLPSGKWRNRLYVGRDENGKRIYESFTAATKKEADALAAVRARELELGEKKAQNPGLLTVSEAIDQYLEINDGILAENTIREYKRCRRLYFQSLMSQRIDRLSPEQISRAINAEAKKHAPKTVRNAWGVIAVSVAAAVPGFRFPGKIVLPEKVKPEIVIPTDDQVRAILEDLRGRSLYIPIALAAACGLRRGEIAALDLKKDVDFERGTIRVRRSVRIDERGNWITVERTKTYTSNRTVECPAWLLDAIREAGPQYKMPSANWITNGFEKTAQKLGFENLHLHCLRHYYASTLIALGVPDRYIMERLGHSTPDMLRTVYGHIISDRDREFGLRISSHLDTLSPMHHEMHHDNSETQQ